MHRPASRVQNPTFHFHFTCYHKKTYTQKLLLHMQTHQNDTMPPIVHVWWLMFLCSLFRGTADPAVCSVQLQDGLTALSNTVIITSHALEESEDAAFLSENHIQLQLNEWRRDVSRRTNRALWRNSESTHIAVLRTCFVYRSLNINFSACQSSTRLWNQTLQVKNYQCLQGQIVIALLLPRASHSATT